MWAKILSKNYQASNLADKFKIMNILMESIYSSMKKIILSNFRKNKIFRKSIIIRNIINLRILEDSSNKVRHNSSFLKKMTVS
jgi:hypothetical protein